MSVQTETHLGGIAIGSRLNSLRLQMADAIAKRKVYHKTLSELDSLTVRELADLGIERGMIKSIARNAAYGEA